MLTSRTILYIILSLFALLLAAQHLSHRIHGWPSARKEGVGRQVHNILRRKTTRDCRDWSVVEYNTVNAAGDDLKNIKDDAEEHEHRLESWNKKWKSYPESFPRSGIGSTLESTQNFRSGLGSVVDYLKAELGKDVISILDASCGDMNWMPTFLRSRPDVEYTGYDLLPVNIDSARSRFANESWDFAVVDLVKERISSRFDLIMSRTVSIHLGLRDNIQMFHNFLQTGSKYLLTTTYPLQTRNTQLFLPEDRKFHEINLSLPPFEFPKPICQAPDAVNLKSARHQFYGFWNLEELRRFEEKNAGNIRAFDGVF